MYNISEITVKVMSVPTNMRQDALRKLNIPFSKVAYIHTACIEPKNLANYFTEPREYTVTIGIKCEPEIIIGC
jgi:2-keto-3-deoxy-6-phosphogluconate aldolase